MEHFLILEEAKQMKQKRTLAFLLALVMVLSFCAFGAGKAAADDDVITFENVIVADDENVTIDTNPQLKLHKVPGI